MFNDVPGSKTHLDGLEEIIRRRSGVAMLDSQPAMRIVLFWFVRGLDPIRTFSLTFFFLLGSTPITLS